MDPTPNSHSDQSDPSQRYETRDVNVPKIVVYLIGLVVAIAIIEVGILGMYRLFVAKKEPNRPLTPVSVISDQRKTLNDHEKKLLGSYSWSDRDKGTVRIPIDRAIDLIVERGAPKGKGPRTLIELQSQHGKKP